MFNTIKVNNTDTDYTHSIFDISEYNSGAIYANLSAALAAVPQEKLKGGMSIKFVTPDTPARYSVVKTENLETEPTGTLLSEAPAIDSGTYDESWLTGVFTTLPSDTGAGNALTYYVAVTVDETTTYTSWVVTKVLNSDNNYVQYFLTKNQWSTSVGDWEKVNLEEEISQLEQEQVFSSGMVLSCFYNDYKGGTNYSGDFIGGVWNRVTKIYEYTQYWKHTEKITNNSKNNLLIYVSELAKVGPGYYNILIYDLNDNLISGINAAGDEARKILIPFRYKIELTFETNSTPIIKIDVESDKDVISNIKKDVENLNIITNSINNFKEIYPSNLYSFSPIGNKSESENLIGGIEDFSSGYINASGNISASEVYVHSNSFIELIPNKLIQISFSSTLGVFFYDSNYNLGDYIHVVTNRLILYWFQKIPNVC